MKILIGNKTICYPITETDTSYFCKLSEMENIGDEEQNVLFLSLTQNTITWLIKTKEGKASKNIGFVSVKPTGNNGTAILEGLTEPFALKNIKNAIKYNKISFVADYLKKVTEYLFSETDINTIITDIPVNQKWFKLLLSQIGFIPNRVIYTLQNKGKENGTTNI